MLPVKDLLKVLEAKYNLIEQTSQLITYLFILGIFGKHFQNVKQSQ